MGGHGSGNLFPGTLGQKLSNFTMEASISVESRKALIAEVKSQGSKIDADKVVGITKDHNGKIVWLEVGRSGRGGSGLVHIMEMHGEQFNKTGIDRSKLPEYLLQALQTGTVVGMQGTRPIYEFLYNGVRQRVAITVSKNGYIVGANPRSLPKGK